MDALDDFQDENGGSFSDYGFLAVAGKRIYVAHWWSEDWKSSISADRSTLTVSGFLTAHSVQLSTPFKHLVLRMLSFCFGRRIIALLKERMIFKKQPATDCRCERVIHFGPESVTVEDSLLLPEGATQVKRAPRASQRHVASADSFHWEDLDLASPGCRVERRSEEKRDGRQFFARTVYRRKDPGEPGEKREDA